MALINHNELISMLDYCESTGVFRWKITTINSKMRPGDVAGTLNKYKGYVNIQINKKLYRANRLAWFYVYKEWPKQAVDHKNGVRSDNSINNLRLANNGQNRANSKTNINNSVGLKGVYTRRGKFYARIRYNHKEIHLGTFSTAEQAHAAYVEAAKKYHGQFARVS